MAALVHLQSQAPTPRQRPAARRGAPAEPDHGIPDPEHPQPRGRKRTPAAPASTSANARPLGMQCAHLIRLQDKPLHHAVPNTTWRARSLNTFERNQVTEAAPELPVALPGTAAPGPQHSFQAISVHTRFADSYS